jgi:hypothetical protein
MSTATDMGFGLTTHAELLAWLRQNVKLTRPNWMHRCDRSSEE